MSGEVETKTKCEVPEKHWLAYSAYELRVYLSKNIKKTDCSFVAKDKGNKEERKVYESFKWILCDMSPVLREILNYPQNQAKNCKEIVVNNAKVIEVILFYFHTKIVDTEIFNLVDFYGASKECQVPTLEDKVIKMFNSLENQKKADWVKLFWLFKKHPRDYQIRTILFEVLNVVDLNNKFAEENIDLILEFNKHEFNEFCTIMVKGNVYSRLKITESYLIKHFFDGDENKSFEKLVQIERDLVQSYINKLQLNHEMFDDADTIYSSKLIHKNTKIRLLKAKLQLDGDASLIKHYIILLQKN